MGESEEKEHEVQEILADLDQILNDISGGDQGKAEAIAHAASTPVLPKPAAAPATAPKPAQQPPTISLSPAPAAKPAAAPAPAPAPAVKPAPVPVAAPQQPPTISLTPALGASAPKPVAAAAPAAAAPAPAPKAVAAPSPAPAPAPAADGLKIELAPREGTLAAPKKEATIPPKAKPAAKPLETRPPLEISLDAPAAASAPVDVPAPAPAAKGPPKLMEVGGPPAAKAPPAPVPVAAAPAPAPVAAAAPPAASGSLEGLKDSIPGKTPKEQIRRVSIIHYGPQLEARDKFLAFLDTSALTVSKKPLYLRKVHGEVYAHQSDAKAVAARAKAASAVAMLVLLDGLPDAKVRELAEACEGNGINFRAVAPDEIQRRSVAVDIMVDLMLLAGEA